MRDYEDHERGREREREAHDNVADAERVTFNDRASLRPASWASISYSYSDAVVVAPISNSPHNPHQPAAMFYFVWETMP